MSLKSLWTIRFERNRAERVALLILCPALIAFCIGILRLLEPLLSSDDMKIARWILHDVMISCILFLSLAFLWAWRRPRWIERLVETSAKSVRLIIAAALAFFLVLCPLVTVIIELARKGG